MPRAAGAGFERFIIACSATTFYGSLAPNFAMLIRHKHCRGEMIKRRHRGQKTGPKVSLDPQCPPTPPCFAFRSHKDRDREPGPGTAPKHEVAATGTASLAGAPARQLLANAAIAKLVPGTWATGIGASPLVRCRFAWARKPGTHLCAAEETSLGRSPLHALPRTDDTYLFGTGVI